jgi:digeranylgeranylglycerophospholipid reductase
MTKVLDAVVVGCGPAGSFFASELAGRGFDVEVFEEHSAVGVPSHCAGHLSIRSLRSRGLFPLPEGIVENVFSTANFYSPSGKRFSVHLNGPVTCAVNRELFDKHLAAKAMEAGVIYHFESRVQSLLLEKGFAKGVSVLHNGVVDEVHARVVVDAEGISSRLLRQTSLSGLNGANLVYAVEAEVENVQGVEEHSVEVYVGKDYAPGFYGWLIPRLNGTAKVGLAVNHGNPKAFLDRLFQKHPVASKQLAKAKVTRMTFHAITLGGLIKQAYADGFLAVGDCASQVKPTTGGGVIFGLTCAKIAAEVAAEALKKGNVSSSSLKTYQERCSGEVGFDMRVMLWARRFLNRISDKQLSDAIGFADKVGFERSLRDVDEIDFQGRTLLTMLKKPASYAILAYLAGLYLSVNARSEDSFY